ncbi:protein of unknown function [Pseudomonas sp. JV241A]|nr:protein of unknown function [Pseudomonas sp. JV241A]
MHISLFECGSFSLTSWHYGLAAGQ